MTETLVGVIGVDTHRDSHTAVALSSNGGVICRQEAAADSAGYRPVLEFGVEVLPTEHRWAVEGPGSYGAGLTHYLVEQGEEVLEVERPKQGSQREALRVLNATRKGAVHARVKAINLLKGLIITAPEDIRESLRGLSTRAQAARCAKFRHRSTANVGTNATVQALRSTPLRIQALEAEARGLEASIKAIVVEMAPGLLAKTGKQPNQLSNPSPHHNHRPTAVQRPDQAKIARATIVTMRRHGRADTEWAD